MSENQNPQEFEANSISQELEASEELSERDLEGIAGGAHGRTWTRTRRFDNAGRLDVETVSNRIWNNDKKPK